MHVGPVFALARTQENIIERSFPHISHKFLRGNSFRCEYMSRLYARIQEEFLGEVFMYWFRARGYGPKCFKTRQTRQFCGYMFVHIFTLYVGGGVSK